MNESYQRLINNLIASKKINRIDMPLVNKMAPVDQDSLNSFSVDALRNMGINRIDMPLVNKAAAYLPDQSGAIQQNTSSQPQQNNFNPQQYYDAAMQQQMVNDYLMRLRNTASQPQNNNTPNRLMAFQ